MDSVFRSRRSSLMKAIGPLFFFCGLLLAGFASPVRAQDGPETDGHEMEFWTTGGHGTNGSTQHTSVWTAGFRYGWVITAPRGPGLLRGRFEYAVDAVPVFVIFQPTHAAYGASISPVGLLWDFDTHSRVVPYIELGGGVLLTNMQVPAGTSRVNFPSAGAIGLHFLADKVTWTADVRFMHISNSGLRALNPGINTVQL